MRSRSVSRASRPILAWWLSPDLVLRASRLHDGDSPFSHLVNGMMLTGGKNVMQKIHLLQFRENPGVADHEYDCFLDKTGLSSDVLKKVSMLDPDLDIEHVLDADAIILGGSGEFLVSKNDIPEARQKSKMILEKALERDLPTLGVCFGSQIMCDAFGGRIELDSDRQETGAFEIDLHDEKEHCPIFKDLPNKFHVMLGHKDHMEALPEGAISLGKSELTPVQAFTFPGSKMYGFLFHPELAADDIIYRLRNYAENYGVNEEGLVELRKELEKDVENGVKALHNFLEEVGRKGRVYGKKGA